MGPSESSSKRIEQRDKAQSARMTIRQDSSTSPSISSKTLNKQIPILPAPPGYNGSSNADFEKSANSNGSTNRPKANRYSSGGDTEVQTQKQGSKKRGGDGGSSIDRSKLRKGKWTIEEEEFTSRIIHHFSVGTLSLPEGMTLRSYIAEKLSCDPMRITKKFAGASCLGKRISGYHLGTNGLTGGPGIVINQRPPMTSVDVDAAKAELLQLEHRFRMRVEHGQSGCLGAAAQAHAVAAAQAVEQAAAYRAMAQSVQHSGGAHNNTSNPGVSDNISSISSQLNENQKFVQGVVTDNQSQAGILDKQQKSQLPFDTNPEGATSAPLFAMPPPLQHRFLQESKHVGNGLVSQTSNGGTLTPQPHPAHLPQVSYATSDLSASLQRALQGSNPQQQSSIDTSAANAGAMALNQVLQNALTQAQQAVSTLPQPVLQHLAVSQLVQNSLQKTIFGSTAAAAAAVATIQPHVLANGDTLTNQLFEACIPSSSQTISSSQPNLQPSSSQSVLPSISNTNTIQQQHVNSLSSLLQQQLNSLPFISPSLGSNNIKVHGQSTANNMMQNQHINMLSNNALSASQSEMNGIRSNLSASSIHQQHQQHHRVSMTNNSGPTQSTSLTSSPSVQSQVSRNGVSRESHSSLIREAVMLRKPSRNISNGAISDDLPKLTRNDAQNDVFERSKEEKDTATMLLSILNTLRSNHNEAMQNLAANDEREQQRATELRQVNKSMGEIEPREKNRKGEIRYYQGSKIGNSRSDSSDNSGEVNGSTEVVMSSISGISEETGKTDCTASGTNTSTTLSSSANGSDSGSASDDRRLVVDGGSETMKTDQSQSSGASGSSEDEDVSDDTASKGNNGKGMPLKKRRKTSKDNSSDSGSDNSTNIGEFTSRNVADHTVRMDALQSSSPFEDNLSRAKMGPSSRSGSNRGANSTDHHEV